jgi:hypothetical protein
MNLAKLTDRVKAILTAPKSEWPLLAAEPASVGSLYTGYIMILAALPVIAAFIKSSLIGYGLLGVTIRIPIMSGLAHAVASYLVSLLVVYVVALVIDALAPTFGGEKNRVQALKATAYAWTATWIAGVAIIIPWLGWLIALAGVVYAIYLLYLGLPPTMKCPPERAGAYTAVSVILAIILSWVLGIIIAAVIGSNMPGNTVFDGAHAIPHTGAVMTGIGVPGYAAALAAPGSATFDVARTSLSNC